MAYYYKKHTITVTDGLIHTYNRIILHCVYHPHRSSYKASQAFLVFALLLRICICIAYEDFNDEIKQQVILLYNS